MMMAHLSIPTTTTTTQFPRRDFNPACCLPAAPPNKTRTQINALWNTPREKYDGFAEEMRGI